MTMWRFTKILGAALLFGVGTACGSFAQKQGNGAGRMTGMVFSELARNRKDFHFRDFS
jgi:hypothetical protein